MALSDEKRDLGLGLGLQAGTSRPPAHRMLTTSDSSEPNSLGLEGVDPTSGSMAPDCDPEAMVQDLP
jgi:hypothetical protein